jgi:hypothetical protein
MKDTIDICFIHADTFLEQYAMETLVEKTKCNINVYSAVIRESYADTINNLINIGDSEYVVFFQSNLLVEDNWCEELLYYSKHIVNSGCVAIANAYNNDLDYQPLLTVKDDLKNVWVSKTNIVEGIIMVKRSLITADIGWFDKLFDNTGFEQAEFSLKLAFSGKNNFYILKHRGLEMETPTRNEKFSKKTPFGVKMINELVKSNINFKETE